MRPSTTCASVIVGSVPPRAVAERAGVGAGRLRPDLERALRREPGDRAAAGADGHDVDHRDLARVTRRPCPRWSASARRRGRPTTSVEVPPPSQVSTGRSRRSAAISAAPSAPAAGPGQHGGDRLVHDLVGATAPRRWTSSRRTATRPGRAAVERRRSRLGDVARRSGATVGLTAASTRVVIARSYSRYSRSTSLLMRHHGVGVLLGEDLAHPLLVRAGWRRRAGSRRRSCRRRGRGTSGRRLAAPSSSKGRTSAPVEVEPAADRAHQVARHDPRRLDPEVGVAVAVGHRLPGDLEHRARSPRW